MKTSGVIIASVVACAVLAIVAGKYIFAKGSNPKGENVKSLPQSTTKITSPNNSLNDKGVGDGDELAPPAKEVPASGVTEQDGIVRVSVFFDAQAEHIRHPEATAILRTKGWLRKTYHDLPKDFSLKCRVVTNEFDEEDRIYSYISEYKKEDILLACGQNATAEKVQSKSGAFIGDTDVSDDF